MVVDLARITAAVHRLVPEVEALLAEREVTKAKLADIAAQLALALADNDPAAVAAAQQAVNQLADDLDTEAGKVEAAEAADAAGPPSA